MKSHPNDEALLIFCGVERRAGSEPAIDAQVFLDVEEHLTGGCARCGLRVREFRDALRLLRGPQLKVVPISWVEAALARLESAEREGRGDRVGGILRRAGDSLREIRLALALDTRAGAPIAGIRGSAPARQILFESRPDREDTSLHLQVESAPRGRLALRGQIVARGAAGGSARKPRGESGRAILEIHGPGSARDERICRLTPRGEFRFRAIPPVRIHLRVESGARVFLAGPVDLG